MNPIDLLEAALQADPHSDAAMHAYLDALMADGALSFCEAVRSAGQWTQHVLRARYLARATHLMREGSEWRDLLAAAVLDAVDFREGDNYTILTVPGDSAPAARRSTRGPAGRRRPYLTITVGAEWLLEEHIVMTERAKLSDHEDTYWTGFERD